MLKKRYLKTKDVVEVTFEVDRPDLSQVDLVCEEGGWQPVQMRRVGKGKGPFRLKMRFPKGGSVQFRYLLDGQWENDEAADAYWPNDYGSDNSVVLTEA